MNGIIIINKHKGCTSHDIVYNVKKIFGEKVGHTGTLDPMATGVLPLLIGKATLCSKYLINHDKTYKVQLQLGKKTDTADSEGKVIEEQKVDGKIILEENIKSVLETFEGEQLQIPPIYSAIKVKGKKLYEYARKGEKVEIEPRKINIYNIKLLSVNKENKQIEFEVECSKGTYIRSLCENIAEKLGTIGYMSELERIQVGEFNINKSVTLSDLENNKENREFIEKNIITLEEFFEEKESIQLNDRKLELFFNGVQLTIEKQEEIYKIYNNNKFIGIGTVKEKLLKRDIIC